MQKKDTFKECTGCGKVWRTMETFLKDKSLKLNGYQWDLLREKSGLLLYTHDREYCGSTISIKAQSFTNRTDDVPENVRKN